MRWVRFAVVLTFVWSVHAQAEQQVVTTWPTTTSYLGFIDFEQAVDGRIYVSAGGRYALYLGGDLVGEGDSEAGLSVYEVSFSRRTNNVALVVGEQIRSA